MIASSVKHFGGEMPGSIPMRNGTITTNGAFRVQSESKLHTHTAFPNTTVSVSETQNGINGHKFGNGHLTRKVDSKVLSEFFHKEPSLYGHEAFKKAAALYEALKHPPVDDPLALHKFKQTRKDSLPDIQFDSDNDKRLVLNLVFSTLKYQRFLEDMLEDCSFYSLYPEYRDDGSLVMVILCDYRQRKFQVRSPLPDEKPDPYLREVERALIKAKTKLNAALARNRIKNNVPSVEKLLPDAVREHEKHANNMHVCCWVNQLKTSIDLVSEQLQVEGFSKTETDEELKGKNYYIDRHCPDVFCFSAEQRQFFEDHPLVEHGHLVIQDKSSCVGAQSIRNLINEGDDILVISGSSCLTAVHLASLTTTTDSTVYMAGVESETLLKQLSQILQGLNAKSKVQLLPVSFTDIDPHDDRLKHIKVILLMTECSRSAVTNPVDFIVTEGEDIEMLRDLSLGKPPDGRTAELNMKHTNILKHALKFIRAQAVVYVTRSLHKVENEAVVTRCVEFINMVQQKKMPWRVSPPVLPLSPRDIESENPLCGKYLIFCADYTSSGCFLAVITREAEDPKDAAKDILARARATGLVAGAPVEAEKDKPVKKKKKNKIIKLKKKESTPVRSASSPQRASPVKVATAKIDDVSPSKPSPTRAKATPVATPPATTQGNTSPPVQRMVSAQKSTSVRRSMGQQKTPVVSRTASPEKKTSESEAGGKASVSVSLQSFPSQPLTSSPPTMSTTRLAFPEEGPHTLANGQARQPSRSLLSKFKGSPLTKHQASSSPAQTAPASRSNNFLKQIFERRKQLLQNEEISDEKVTYQLFHMGGVKK